MQASIVSTITFILAVPWWSAREADSVPEATTSNAVLVAQQGCCKAYDTYSREWQVLYGFDYYACEAENAQRDGDDVYQPSGEIWWDASC